MGDKQWVTRRGMWTGVEVSEVGRVKTCERRRGRRGIVEKRGGARGGNDALAPVNARGDVVVRCCAPEGMFGRGRRARCHSRRGGGGGREDNEAWMMGLGEE